jgi:hypothetical protein
MSYSFPSKPVVGEPGIGEDNWGTLLNALLTALESAINTNLGLIGSHDHSGVYSPVGHTHDDMQDAIDAIESMIDNWAMSLATKSVSLSISYYAAQGIAFLFSMPVLDSSDNVAQGNYRFQYVFKNQAATINWATDPDIEEIATPSNYANIPTPESGDTLFSGGTAGKCYLYCRLRFENLSTDDNATDWSADSLEIDEPETVGEEYIRLLAAQGENAQKVLDREIAGLQRSPSLAALIAANLNQHLYGSGAPAISPTSLDQVYHDISTGDIYHVSYNGTTMTFVKVYDHT